MKKLSLLLLVYGMYIGTFAQPEISKGNNAEVSEKWVITPVPNMKGVLGRLDINFPADVIRNILIYQQADKKFLTSVSRNATIFTIAPGEYRFVLSTVPIDNVPIRKGHETRLRAGFLDVVSEGAWFLYDETKEKYFTSGDKPQKIVLPVGSYHVKLGGQFFPVKIKDGETVEDSSPVGTLISDPVNEAFNESKSWTITPKSGIPNGMGRLNIKFPEGQTITINNPVTGTNETINIPVLGKPDCALFIPALYYQDPIEVPISLTPRDDYGVIFSRHGISVPIREGHETRLKAGFLIITFDRSWELRKRSPDNTTIHFGDKPKFYALPPGEYTLQVFGVLDYYYITIKDGETVKNGKKS